MSWLTINNNEHIYVHETKPYRAQGGSFWWSEGNKVRLSTGSIKKLTDKKLTWDDEPIEI